MICEAYIAGLVFNALTAEGIVQVEASARHVHLCREDADILFGKGVKLTEKRALSQKGEFLCEERVSIVTERRTMRNVAVLGPIRPKSQVELSLTDGVSFGLKLPVRDSGDVTGSPGILLRAESGRPPVILPGAESEIFPGAPPRVESGSLPGALLSNGLGDSSVTADIVKRAAPGETALKYGCIAARRHLHASPAEAKILGLTDGQVVAVEVFGTRKAVFYDVLTRVRDTFRLRVHLDMDEANAAGIDGFALGRLII